MPAQYSPPLYLELVSFHRFLLTGVLIRKRDPHDYPAIPFPSFASLRFSLVYFDEGERGSRSLKLAKRIQKLRCLFYNKRKDTKN